MIESYEAFGTGKMVKWLAPRTDNGKQQQQPLKKFTPMTTSQVCLKHIDIKVYVIKEKTKNYF